MSRLSATFSSFIVAYMLKEAGVTGVFGLITAAMLIVVIAMALFGPNVRGKPRAQRSNPVCLRGETLDCFVAKGSSQ
jgi:hypothetical protein